MCICECVYVGKGLWPLPLSQEVVFVSFSSAYWKSGLCVCEREREGGRVRQSETERETVCLFLWVCARALLPQHVGDQVYLCECEYIYIYI